MNNGENMEPFLDIGTLVIYELWRPNIEDMELVVGIITKVNRKIWNNHRILIPKYNIERMENRCKIYIFTEENWENLYKERVAWKN